MKIWDKMKKERTFSNTGKNCETEDYLDALPEMLVGIELIDIQTED